MATHGSETEPTTETIVRELKPAQRAEVIALAARLQAGEAEEAGESAALLAATREAGIDDRFVREAAERLRTPVASEKVSERSLWTAWPRLRWAETIGFVPALVILLAVLAQLQAGLVAHASAYGQEPWATYLLAASLAFAFPRKAPRWAPIALVGAIWAVILVANHIVSVGPTEFSLPLVSSEALALRFAFYSLLSAGAGIVVARLSPAASVPVESR